MINIDVSEALDEFLEDVTLTRAGVGGRDANGDWVEAVSVVSTIQVVAQSLTANERIALPEAVRSKETKKFHTRTALKTVDETTPTDADIITQDGNQWEINQVFNRNTNGGYFKAIGIKI